MPSPASSPAAGTRRPPTHEPPSFKQPRANEGLTQHQRRAVQRRAGARHDALVTAWLRALART
jgi:hypothetical protein